MEIEQETVIKEVERSRSGGTLMPMLGTHALGHRFETSTYINNLNLFDPTWFASGKADSQLLIKKKH